MDPTDLRFNGLLEAQYKAMELNEAGPQQGWCSVKSQKCNVILYSPARVPGPNVVYKLMQQTQGYSCSPGSLCNELGTACVKRWKPAKTLCDYVDVIAEMDTPGCIP
ncbi:hypothetical protein ACCO45_004621 [Purpureocillium lilacinum]|uniref:Uncharacterized protein n=1 Tax=Purpureocillium lilacinum TaxID=33203 RepID=A0ACC4DVA9_PURLI